jgi:hypothetical protein
MAETPTSVPATAVNVTTSTDATPSSVAGLFGYMAGFNNTIPASSGTTSGGGGAITTTTMASGTTAPPSQPTNGNICSGGTSQALMPVTQTDIVDVLDSVGVPIQRLEQALAAMRAARQQAGLCLGCDQMVGSCVCAPPQRQGYNLTSPHQSASNQLNAAQLQQLQSLLGGAPGQPSTVMSATVAPTPVGGQGAGTIPLASQLGYAGLLAQQQRPSLPQTTALSYAQPQGAPAHPLGNLLTQNSQAVVPASSPLASALSTLPQATVDAIPAYVKKELKTEKFSGDAASEEFRTWFPRFDLAMQMKGIELAHRGHMLTFSCEGEALRYLEGSGWAHSANYPGMVEALDREFQPRTCEFYAAELRKFVQFEDEQVSQFIRRLQRCVFQAYPTTDRQTQDRLVLEHLRQGCDSKFMYLLEGLGNELGLDTIRARLIAFENNRSANAERRHQQKMQRNGQGHYRRGGIIAVSQEAREKPTEELQAVVETECKASEEEPLTAAQMRQVTQEQADIFASAFAKAAANAQKEVTTQLRSLAHQVARITDGEASGNGNGGAVGTAGGNRGRGGGYRGRGRGMSQRGGGYGGAARGRSRYIPAKYPEFDAQGQQQCQGCAGHGHFIRDCP